MLERAGLPEPEPDALARWEQAACAAYSRLEVDGDEHASTAQVLAGLRDAGHALALLTGNLEPIARHKLSLRGLEGFFPAGQGGFGSDAELRPELVPIARARAGAHPREDTVLIGDTPFDVTAASADGVRSVAITGHRFSASDLIAAGAVATVDELAELKAVLAGLAKAK